MVNFENSLCHIKKACGVFSREIGILFCMLHQYVTPLAISLQLTQRKLRVNNRNLRGICDATKATGPACREAAE